MTVGRLVAVEDDFSSGPRTNPTAPANTGGGYQMNPNHSYGGPTPGFYGGPGPTPGYPPGGPGVYPPPHGAGPMSPYGGGGPMSPYSGQGQPPPGGQPAMYANQNSPFHNQNQSSPYSGPGPGPYNDQSSGGGFPAMQSYYSNQSPPSHGSVSAHQWGQQHPAQQHQRPLASPPPHGPARGMPYPARIPHPNINSPNQNTVVTGNQIKTENMDLKAGSLYAATSQGYNQSGFGYNGFGGPGQPSRPLVSPGGPPNLSPRAPGPPSMSPHHPLGSNSLYSQQQSSPGNNHIAASQASTFPPPPSGHHPGYSGQYEYFGKQASHASPQYPAVKEETYDPHRPPSFPSDERSLSDVQSNASARSTGDDTPKHSSFGDDSNPTVQGGTITNLVNIKKEPSGDTPGDDLSTSNAPPSDEKQSTGDSEEKKVTPKSEPEEPKPEGSYFEEQNKDFTLNANQNIIDNMNLDSIPELPEIPELKYEDMGGETKGNNHQQSGASPREGTEEENRGPLGRVTMEEFMKNPNEEGGGGGGGGYGSHDQWGHMQGMESGFPHQMGGYPNQSQMWANFYGPGSGGPPGEHPAPRFPHPGAAAGPPHMGMDGGWWQGHPHPPGPPDMGPYRMGTPGLGGLAPGPWALRGPRPRGERRGPGRPRLTTKGERGSRGRAVTHPTDDPQFPTPFPDGLAPDMMGGPPDMKRGPGRPKALLDPNVPKVPGETTKNGNKKRYTCEICQKRFSTAWYVRVHRRSHNGERPYVCNNCGKGFMLPNVLQVHLRKCEKNNPPAPGSAPVGPAPPGTLPGPPGHRHLDPAAQLAAAQVPPSPISSQPNQSPNSTASPNLTGPPSFGDYHGEVPGSIAQSQGGGQQFPGMSDFNQRYMGGLSSPPGPPFPPGLGGGGDVPPMPPISQPQQFQGGEQAVTGGFAMHQQPSPHERGSPHQVPPGSHQQYSSPIYSPNYSPTNSSRPGPPSDSSENHFLDNDKPLDKGGGTGGKAEGERPRPPGGDPSLYSTTSEDKASCEEDVKTHRPFSCEICEKRFSQKCNLVTHMRLHTGEKPYNCEYCDKRFTQKGNLDAHTKTHTKEKPYPCVYCPKRFAFKSSMQSHVRGHQNGVGCPPDVDEDDMDALKDQMRLSKDSQEEVEEEEEGMEQANEEFSPSISPPTYGGTIKQFNATGSPETDNISKLTDSRQTVAMLQ